MSANAQPQFGGRVLFGLGLIDELGRPAELMRLAAVADRDGLDLVAVPDHPSDTAKVDAYAAVGVLLGRTTRVTGLVNVTNLPTRPAPMLARTVAGLSAASGGRFVLGIGAGGLWDEITKFGVPGQSAGAAVRALEEAIVLIRALCGGGEPFSFDGEFYQVTDLEPAPMPAPPVWTGSGGPRSLAVTGRVADGWIPRQASDWRSPRVAESRPVIDAAAVAAGRRPGDIATIYNVAGRINDSPLVTTRNEHGRWIGGSVDQWVDELTTAVLEFGASGFIHHRIQDATSVDLTIGRWTQEIVPGVRQAVGEDGS
jgi:alkanesulfonate monooxygenase SsuD/methylene tetrahydromethanopterin reductase-like flavin-dependent oxidoreductase (luciferase family)